MGIRAYLAAMAAVLLVPLVVLSGFGLDRLLRDERASAIQGVLETARTVSLAVDQELVSAEAALRVLATSAHLGAGNWGAFHAQAQVARTNDAATILLFEPGGHVIVDTSRPYAEAPASHAFAQAVSSALQNGQASVSGVQRGPEAQQFAILVAVPVQLDTGRYIVAQAIGVSHFQRVLAERKVPSEWIVGVFDRDHLVVASNPRAREMIGKPGADTIRQAAQGRLEGQLRHPSREGVDVYDVFTRSPHSGWLVAVGVPADALDAYARKAVALAALGVLATIALACAIVLALGRRLGNSIASLTGAAAALGRGEALPPHVASVKEVDCLRGALENTHAALERESDARARAEAQRLQSFESEQAAREAAEQQNRAKDEFLAMLGHELRNPLSAISGAVALMKLSPAQDRQWQHAREVIARQTQHLSRVVDDLLDLSRIMTGKVALERVPLDLAQVAADCLDTMRTTGRIGAHQVVPRLESVWVNADRTRLEQVIVNLLSNAVKYTPQDGRIELRVSGEGDQALLCVKDTGLGIPKHLLPNVFEIFVQGEQTLDRAKGGLGIGLALVQRLVRLHGGTVTAESPGDTHGSAFTVRLPRLAGPKQSAADAAEPSEAPHRLRVLVVDDHEDSRTMLRMLLEQTGHEAIEAVDGIDGVQLALSRRPDVAVIDIGLPGIDGYEVARRLRTLPTGANMVLIALTGYGQDEDRQRALQAGYDVHLVKPVDPQRLTQALVEVASTRAAARS